MFEASWKRQPRQGNAFAFTGDIEKISEASPLFTFLGPISLTRSCREWELPLHEFC